MNGSLVLYTLISLMMLLWSANFIIGKVALREFPPVLLGALRIGLAGVVVLPVYWRKVRARRQQFRPGRGLLLPVLLAVCNIGNQLLFLVGLSRTSVAHSALIIGVAPIFVLLFAARIGLEQITLRRIAGMVIALAGVTTLVHQASARQVSAEMGPTLAGDAATALACILFSLFATYAKKATEHYGTLAVNGFAYISGAALLAPIVLWQAHEFAFGQVTAAAWISLVYMALFPSLLCYVIYYYALTHISASRLAAFLYLEPVIAILMAAALLGERITAPLVSSGAVIFAGVYLSERG